ncbi:bifunctional phosphoglucose/phosphomannose isomerase, partial [candidate division WOR-3 bacterium]|nr:bifunctional phosphoglucose/phosphomannose isomerase [candidate division WOR-3 bacterium]
MAVDGYRRMLGLVRALPGQLVEALELAGRVRLPAWPRPAAVMVAGMGGSAIGGDVIRGVLSDRCPVPVSVVRDYRLPATAGPGTLLFVVSYSGNTEETLATYHEGLRRRCRMVVTASGGELARLAENHGQPFFR